MTQIGWVGLGLSSRLTNEQAFCESEIHSPNRIVIGQARQRSLLRSSFVPTILRA